MNRSPIVAMVAGLTLIAMSPAGAATVLVDNLQNPELTYHDGLSFYQIVTICQTFNSGTATKLTDVAVNLYRKYDSSAGNYYVELYAVDNNTHAPTSFLNTLGSGKVGDLDVLTTSAVNCSGLSIGLSASTDYAICVRTDTDDLTRLGRYDWSNSSLPPDGFNGYNTWQTTMRDGSPYSTDVNSYPLRMRILGETAAVPEPGQWAGMGVVAVGASLLALRRRAGCLLRR